MRGDLLHGELVVAFDRELSLLETLLGVREGDVEQLRIGAHDLLGHLLEGLLLLLGLLLEGLPLLLGLLHPLLGRLLEGLLLLLGLTREIGTWSVQELHVGVHHLLDHLLGVLLLLLDLLGQALQHGEPLLPRLFWHPLRCTLYPTVGVSVHHHLLLARTLRPNPLCTRFRAAGTRGQRDIAEVTIRSYSPKLVEGAFSEVRQQSF